MSLSAWNASVKIALAAALSLVAVFGLCALGRYAANKKKQNNSGQPGGGKTTNSNSLSECGNHFLPEPENSSDDDPLVHERPENSHLYVPHWNRPAQISPAWSSSSDEGENPSEPANRRINARVPVRDFSNFLYRPVEQDFSTEGMNEFDYYDDEVGDRVYVRSYPLSSFSGLLNFDSFLSGGDGCIEFSVTEKNLLAAQQLATSEFSSINPIRIDNSAYSGSFQDIKNYCSARGVRFSTHLHKSQAFDWKSPNLDQIGKIKSDTIYYMHDLVMPFQIYHGNCQGFGAKSRILSQIHELGFTEYSTDSTGRFNKLKAEMSDVLRAIELDDESKRTEECRKLINNAGERNQQGQLRMPKLYERTQNGLCRYQMVADPVNFLRELANDLGRRMEDYASSILDECYQIPQHFIRRHIGTDNADEASEALRRARNLSFAGTSVGEAQTRYNQIILCLNQLSVEELNNKVARVFNANGGHCGARLLEQIEEAERCITDYFREKFNVSRVSKQQFYSDEQYKCKRFLAVDTKNKVLSSLDVDDREEFEMHYNECFGILDYMIGLKRLNGTLPSVCDERLTRVKNAFVEAFKNMKDYYISEMRQSASAREMMGLGDHTADDECADALYDVIDFKFTGRDYFRFIGTPNGYNAKKSQLLQKLSKIEEAGRNAYDRTKTTLEPELNKNSKELTDEQQTRKRKRLAEITKYNLGLQLWQKALGRVEYPCGELRRWINGENEIDAATLSDNLEEIYSAIDCGAPDGENLKQCFTEMLRDLSLELRTKEVPVQSEDENGELVDTGETTKEDDIIDVKYQVAGVALCGWNAFSGDTPLWES